MEGQQTCRTACRLDNMLKDIYSELNFNLTKSAIAYIQISLNKAVVKGETGLHHPNKKESRGPVLLHVANNCRHD